MFENNAERKIHLKARTRTRKFKKRLLQHSVFQRSVIHSLRTHYMKFHLRKNSAFTSLWVRKIIVFTTEKKNRGHDITKFSLTIEKIRLGEVVT